MKYFLAFGAVLSLSALIVMGCGGGGTGGGGGPYVVVRVELPGRDPINIVVGQTVQFELAGYNFSGQRDRLQATGWFILDNPAVGTIDQSGNFTATSPGTARILATWAGTPNAQTLTIVVKPAGLARYSGRVVNNANSAGVTGITVIFYDNNNVEVGRAITTTGGNFLAQVPTTATRMNLDPASLTGWLVQWKYRTLIYQAGNGIPNCHAIIVAPPLVPNQTSNIADPVRLYDSTVPPPFPTGCS